MNTEEELRSAAGLSPDLRQLWGVLADAGGSASPAVLAALTDTSTAAARRSLWALERAGAVTESGGIFACAQVAWEGELCRSALAATSWRRVTRWYLATAYAAAGILRSRALPGGEVIEPDPGRPPLGFDGVAGVLDWYRGSRGELVAAIERARTLRDETQCWRLALLDAQIAVVAGPHPDWEHPLDLGTQAAVDAAEPRAYLSEYRGKLALHFGRYDQARTAHEEALALREQAGDLTGQMRSHNALALLYLRSDTAAAGEHFTVALDLAHRLGDEYFSALIRANLASALCEQGHHAPARDLLQKAITYLREHGPDYYLANALYTMARTLRCEGAVPLAAGWARRALEVATAAGLPLFIAGALAEHAEVSLADGDRAAALDALHEAVAIHAAYGDTVRAGHLGERIEQITGSS